MRIDPTCSRCLGLTVGDDSAVLPDGRTVCTFCVEFLLQFETEAQAFTQRRNLDGRIIHTVWIYPLDSIKIAIESATGKTVGSIQRTSGLWVTVQYADGTEARISDGQRLSPTFIGTIIK